jgi:hypothetical protein
MLSEELDLVIHLALLLQRLLDGYWVTHHNIP